MKKYLICLLLTISIAKAQQLAPLTVEKIMRDPKWMGVAPSNYRWSADSKKVFFSWNPENKDKDVLYSVGLNGLKPQKEDEKALEKAIGMTLTFGATISSALFEKGGDIYLFNPKTKEEQRLTNTVERENG
ncbi:MAG: S9 family peptidase, partial [Pedobacter sp.]|nr:S9 family peptidase [Pedobacter sp.]